MKLSRYNEKRNFDATKEPRGRVKKGKNNKFVVQLHHARAKHYDFRLEHNGVLISFAIPKGLSFDPKERRLAVHVEDHPLDYINFEGIIPKGNYGAGTVEIFDKGCYEPLIDMQKGLEKGHLKVNLFGKKLQGAWSLVKIDEKNWLAIKMEDKYAKNSEKITKKSIKLPKITPQLAVKSDKLPSGAGWLYEIKYDGYRVIAYKNDEKITLKSRKNTDLSEKFPEICQAIKKLDAKNLILDGEVVVFDERGKSDFGLLHKGNYQKSCYVVFDLLFFDNECFLDKKLIDRKRKLEFLLYSADKRLVYSDFVTNGKKCLEFAKYNNLEGVVAKKSSSIYKGDRVEDWLKIKCSNRQEFVIGGYTTTTQNPILSALYLGYYKDDELVFVGKVGTGFTEKTRKELVKIMKPLIRKTCPFANFEDKNAIWLSPKLVAEIQYNELTAAKILRQPSFLGLRTDKNAKKVVLEE